MLISLIQNPHPNLNIRFIIITIVFSLNFYSSKNFHTHFSDSKSTLQIVHHHHRRNISSSSSVSRSSSSSSSNKPDNKPTLADPSSSSPDDRLCCPNDHDTLQRRLQRWWFAREIEIPTTIESQIEKSIEEEIACDSEEEEEIAFWRRNRVWFWLFVCGFWRRRSEERSCGTRAILKN